MLVAVEDLGVALAEHVRLHGVLDRLGDLGGGRPDVAQVYGLTRRVGPERVARQVDVHRPGERVGDDERRRGEVVHLDILLIRPSKLRLPDSTATTARSCSSTAAEISSGSGPELPMQVVQP